VNEHFAPYYAQKRPLGSIKLSFQLLPGANTVTFLPQNKVSVENKCWVPTGLIEVTCSISQIYGEEIEQGRAIGSRNPGFPLSP